MTHKTHYIKATAARVNELLGATLTTISHDGDNNCYKPCKKKFVDGYDYMLYFIPTGATDLQHEEWEEANWREQIDYFKKEIMAGEKLLATIEKLKMHRDALMEIANDLKDIRESNTDIGSETNFPEQHLVVRDMYSELDNLCPDVLADKVMYFQNDLANVLTDMATYGLTAEDLEV